MVYSMICLNIRYAKSTAGITTCKNVGRLSESVYQESWGLERPQNCFQKKLTQFVATGPGGVLIN